MSSQILRPTQRKQAKGSWVVEGTWGKRTYDPMSKTDFYQVLHRELIESGVLPSDSPMPSNKYHSHVTMAIVHSSWTDGRWVIDQPALVNS